MQFYNIQQALTHDQYPPGRPPFVQVDPLLRSYRMRQSIWTLISLSHMHFDLPWTAMTSPGKLNSMLDFRETCGHESLRTSYLFRDDLLS